MKQISLTKLYRYWFVVVVSSSALCILYVDIQMQSIFIVKFNSISALTILYFRIYLLCVNSSLHIRFEHNNLMYPTSAYWYCFFQIFKDRYQSQLFHCVFSDIAENQWIWGSCNQTFGNDLWIYECFSLETGISLFLILTSICIYDKIQKFDANQKLNELFKMNEKKATNEIETQYLS